MNTPRTAFATLAAALSLCGAAAAQVSTTDFVEQRRSVGNRNVQATVTARTSAGTHSVQSLWGLQSNGWQTFMDNELRIDSNLSSRPLIEVGTHAFAGDSGTHGRAGTFFLQSRGHYGAVRIDGTTRDSSMSSSSIQGIAYLDGFLPGSGKQRNYMIGTTYVTVATDCSAAGSFAGSANVQQRRSIGSANSTLVASASAQTTVLATSTRLPVALTSDLDFGTHQLRMRNGTNQTYYGQAQVDWSFGRMRCYESLAVGSSRYTRPTVLVNHTRSATSGSDTLGWFYGG